MTTIEARLCVACGSSVAGRGRRLYCGPRCAAIVKSCAQCGREYETTRKRRARPCCSVECANEYRVRNRRVDRIVCTCGTCGRPFEKYPSQVALGRGLFCSRSCAMTGRPINGKPSILASEVLDLVESTGVALAREVRIGRWSVDAVIAGSATAVELDGAYWHSLPEMVERDRRKDVDLSKRGWTVVRVAMNAHESAAVIADRVLEAIR